MGRVHTVMYVMRCHICNHSWEDAPGQLGRQYGGCPMCHGVYWSARMTHFNLDVETPLG